MLAIVLCLIASFGSYLLWTNERHLRRGTQPRFWLSKIYLRNMIKTDGRHRLGLGSYIEIPEAFLLIAIPSWVAIDDPLWARLIMLAAGMSFLVSTALLIFNDHTWFNPEEANPPAWHEIFRLFAGPIVALLVCVIALPADWGPNGWLAALAISLIPLTISLRISDTDLIMKPLPALVLEESHAGRELVISETHGALSTHLRLLEQQAREIRHLAPSLYELAVSANSRLRETLTLSQLGRDSSTTVQNLEAPVLTLARAVGAKAVVEVTVGQLSARRPGPGPTGAERPGRQRPERRRRGGARADHRRGTAAVDLSYRRRSPDGSRGVEDFRHEFCAPGDSTRRTLRVAHVGAGAGGQDGDCSLGAGARLSEQRLMPPMRPRCQ